MCGEGLLITTDGGACQLVTDVTPLYPLGGGVDDGVEDFEGDIMLPAKLLCNSLNAIGEIVDED